MKTTRQHVPQRTCATCRKVKPKPDLIRLVRTADGRIEIDTSGKKAGRGAYLCRTYECWESGLKSGRLGNALRTNLTRDNREYLIKYLGQLTLPAGVQSP